MTPEFYQTHKVRNILKHTASVTMQCYSYLGNDSIHREQFDYLSEIDKKLYRFRPKRDFNFDVLLEKTKKEYESKWNVRDLLAIFCFKRENVLI